MPALRKDYYISSDPVIHGIGGSASGGDRKRSRSRGSGRTSSEGAERRRQLPQPARRARLPAKVLASERKPIRVYLCDGWYDNRGLRDGRYDETRDWFHQNVRLMKALAHEGYDVNYSWGMNNHGPTYGGALLPDMMRWLLRDGPGSTDPKDEEERGFRQPVKKKDQGCRAARPRGSRPRTLSRPKGGDEESRCGVSFRAIDWRVSRPPSRRLLP